MAFSACLLPLGFYKSILIAPSSLPAPPIGDKFDAGQSLSLRPSTHNPEWYPQLHLHGRKVSNRTKIFESYP